MGNTKFPPAIGKGPGGDRNPEGGEMARILIQADDERTVLLDEKQVCPAHLNDEHSAMQLLERVEWAIRDEDRRVRTRRAPTRRLGWHQSGLKHTFD